MKISNELIICYGYAGTDYAVVTLPHSYNSKITALASTSFNGYFSSACGDPCVYVNSMSSITCHTGALGAGTVYWLTIGY